MTSSVGLSAAFVNVVVSIGVVIATLHRWTQAGDGDETQQERRGDEGGGGPRPWPDAPEPGGGDSDLSWWPKFERQLSLYVAKLEGENRAPVLLPTEPSPHVMGARQRPTAWTVRPDRRDACRS